MNRSEFQAIYVHSSKNDGMTIIVGSGFKKESDIPHAHIWSLDESFEGRFRIDNPNPPQNSSEILLVDDTDVPISGDLAEKIVNWASKPSEIYNENNWEAMRQSWRDIEEQITEELVQPFKITKNG